MQKSYSEKKMFKKITVAVLVFMGLFLMTGCVQPDITPGDQSWWHKKSADDVDLSDLDDNMTVSEMMITEDGEERMARIEFPVAEYTRLPRKGRGTITGKIYVNDLYGTPVYGGGTRLYLNPVTSYSEQWYEASYLGGNKMEKADGRLFNYLKFTAADSSGKFSFYGVPSGSYYLIGTVKCGSACGYESEKSIRIATKVSVYGNQIIEQDLTSVPQ